MSTARGVVAAAALAGILGDLLLRAPVGLGAALWVATVAACGVWLFRRHSLPHAVEVRWLLAAILFLAAGLAWRDAPVLRLLDILLLLATAALAASQARRAGLARASLLSGFTAALYGMWQFFCGAFFLLSRDVDWPALAHQPHGRSWLGVLRGLALAVPLLLLFGSLFAAADDAFRRLVSHLFQDQLGILLGHLLLAALLAWIVAGALRAASWGQAPDWEQLASPVEAGRPILGPVEVATILGSLNALFLSFVLVQFGHLFGGASRVQSLAGLTYAGYARQGFFELVAVVALILPLLLIGHWLLRKDEPASERVFRRLGAGLLGLVGVVAASALQRWVLYVTAYGLTPARLYGLAFMIGLLAVLAWLAATVLRGRRERFLWGALLLAYLLVAGLHVVNPDALVARVNIEHGHATGRFDAATVAALSADAVPVVLRALPGLPPGDACTLARLLLARWDGRGPADAAGWRAWNLGRSRASAAVAQHRARLEAGAACFSPPSR